jgi:nucleoside 2-deoxyribosyltransferase
MKVYIATRLERHRDHNAVRDLLARFGHELTYDWTVHGPVWRDGLARIREVSQLEARGVLGADLVSVLLPGGRGTHTELGMAIAAGKPVLLHSFDPMPFEAVPETCAFYHHPLVRRTSDPFEDLVLLADAMLSRGSS